MMIRGAPPELPYPHSQRCRVRIYLVYDTNRGFSFLLFSRGLRMSDAREAKNMENGERLAKVEQKIDNIERVVSEVNENLKMYTQVYVPRTEIDLMFRQRDKELQELDNRIEKKADTKEVERIIKEKDNWQRNLPAWAAFALAALAFLVPYLIK